jgi:NAD(P)-dependent dehydrogenase (short-subunit alcohol dehydrogenase family)
LRHFAQAALNHYNKAFAGDEPDIISVGVHPGWVQTDMGGANAAVTVGDSAKGIVHHICQFTKEDSGKLVDYEGNEMSP